MNVPPKEFMMRLLGKWAVGEYSVTFSQNDTGIDGVISGPQGFSEYLQFSPDLLKLQIIKSNARSQNFECQEFYRYRDAQAPLWYEIKFELTESLRISATSPSGKSLIQLHLKREYGK